MRQAINIEQFKQFDFNPREITNHKILKDVLKRKHLGITRAAIDFGIDLCNLSRVIKGYSYTVWIVQSIQDDLGLSNKQVLQLWPQLKEWPRLPYSRVRTAKQRNRLNNRKKELV